MRHENRSWRIFLRFILIFPQFILQTIPESPVYLQLYTINHSLTHFMKRVLIIVSFSLLLFSCSKEKVRGGGSVITENRNLANFTGITVFGSSAVQITQGSSFRVEVRGYGNLLPYYETRIVNNNLEMGYKNNVNVKNDNIQVLITMPALNSISLHG
jgi:hypothetical protein